MEMESIDASDIIWTDDGYQAVQIGFGEKDKNSKSLQGHLKDHY